MQIGKEKIKLSLFTNDMRVCRKIPSKLLKQTHKQPLQISKLNKVVGFKSNKKLNCIFIC